MFANVSSIPHTLISDWSVAGQPSSSPVAEWSVWSANHSFAIIAHLRKEKENHAFIMSTHFLLESK